MMNGKTAQPPNGTAPMRLLVRVFQEPAPGEVSEDAYCINENDSLCALSDGAAQNYLSGPWAECLVEQVCRAGLPPEPSVEGWLDAPRRVWQARAEELKQPGAPWFLDDANGATGATLV